MTDTDNFSETYREAREKFLAAAALAGYNVSSFGHDKIGPHGRPLYCDTARRGPADASRLLLTVSGTHGIEGYCGAACQVNWLWQTVPGDLAILHVHGINPYGLAWARRVDDENIDINRNFIDFAEPLPENPAYDELADSLAPDIWDEVSDRISRITWREFIEREGEETFTQAIMLGQYRHPQGLYFGGQAPSWSHRTFQDIVRANCADVRHLAILDLHSGLGARGQGELVCRHPKDGEAFKRAERWYGERVAAPVLGDRFPAGIAGTLRHAPEAWLKDCQITALAVEFGTYPADQVFEAMRADNWLQFYGDETSPRGQAIKARMREMFNPDDALWRVQVLEQAQTNFARALKGLAA